MASWDYYDFGVAGVETILGTCYNKRLKGKSVNPHILEAVTMKCLISLHRKMTYDVHEFTNHNISTLYCVRSSYDPCAKQMHF